MERAGDTEPKGCTGDGVCDGVLEWTVVSWDAVERFDDGPIFERPKDFLCSKIPLPVRA